MAHGPLVFCFLPDMAVEPRRLLKHLITEEKVKQVSYVYQRKQSKPTSGWGFGVVRGGGGGRVTSYIWNSTDVLVE